MQFVLVRYSDIGTKGRHVRRKMLNVLRQRVEDRLVFEDIEFEKISASNGRIIVELPDPERSLDHIAELPGIASVSPAAKTGSDIEQIKDVSESFEYGDTFGVDANRTGQHEFDTRDLKVELGSHIEELTGSSVDLDNPETLLEVDVRHDEAFVFTQRVQGPGGLPVGSQETLAALVSGGIDSPVAAYQVMKRGSHIIPIYFYNKPIAAEDHLMRFQAVIKKLRRFNPGKKWSYYIVDMEEVNNSLMNIDRGRMLLHRFIMFRVAEGISRRKSLKGMVTGEALGQKSTQTASNLEITTKNIDKPIFRPLIGLNKNEIIRVSKKLGTYEEAVIDSACSSLAPKNPATKISEEDFEELKQRLEISKLVETALENTEKCIIQDQKD